MVITVRIFDMRAKRGHSKHVALLVEGNYHYGSSRYRVLSTSGLEEDSSLLFQMLSISMLLKHVHYHFFIPSSTPNFCNHLNIFKHTSFGRDLILSSQGSPAAPALHCLLKAGRVKFWVFIRGEVVPLVLCSSTFSHTL